MSGNHWLHFECLSSQRTTMFDASLAITMLRSIDLIAFWNAEMNQPFWSNLRLSVLLKGSTEVSIRLVVLSHTATHQPHVLSRNQAQAVTMRQIKDDK